MQPIHIYVLGPEGAGRTALETTFARLGCMVSTADAASATAERAGADILMLDVRDDDARWTGLARGLRDDARPVMVVSEGPTDAVRELARRPAGTVVMSGAESDAGYRVALSVLQGLRDRAMSRSARNGDTLTGLAAL
jgi:hypothetical protein